MASLKSGYYILLAICYELIFKDQLTDAALFLFLVKFILPNLQLRELTNELQIESKL